MNTDAASPEFFDQQLAHHRVVVGELVDMGAELARMVHSQAQSGELALEAATVAFDRVARCVRRSAALARRLAEPVPEDGSLSHARYRVVARERILRTVEDRIGWSEADDERAELLRGELRERLDSAELDADVRDRPVMEIVAEICRDLGLADAPGATPWLRRKPAAVAALWRQAARDPARRASGASASTGAVLADHRRWRRET